MGAGIALRSIPAYGAIFMVAGSAFYKSISHNKIVEIVL
jgi:hypothetical protein